MLNGANVMCQGFTSAGGRLVDAAAGEVIVVMAEGKEHALAIGWTEKSTQAIREENSGIGVENLHFLNDDLWKLKELKKTGVKA